MNRGDILAKLQSTSAAETRTLSITDAARPNNSDANIALNAFDAQSVFKLISSASDLEQRHDSDKEETDSAKNEATAQSFDMQATTKNKRKNFKPRSATAVDDFEPPSLTDQLILNLMMQNKMKQLQQELHQGQLKTASTEYQSADGDRGTSNSNDSNNILKSPPSSPLTNGHATAGGMNRYLHILSLSTIYYYIN